MHNIFKMIIFFTIGAILYPILEILFRGYSHWSMSIAGGLSFLFICEVNRLMPHGSIWLKCLIGAAAITVIEFITGYIVNIQLNMGVWDYSHLPLNIMGQICLPFTVLWFFLCIPAYGLGNVVGKLLDKI